LVKRGITSTIGHLFAVVKQYRLLKLRKDKTGYCEEVFKGKIAVGCSGE